MKKEKKHNDIRDNFSLKYSTVDEYYNYFVRDYAARSVTISIFHLRMANQLTSPCALRT